VRILLWTATVAAAVALCATAAAAPQGSRLESPTVAELAYAGTISDSSTPATTRTLQASSWGGTYTASTGEPLTIFASSSYPQDEATLQHWADFVASLLHGPEITRVRIFLAPLREVRQTCGRTALACYDDRDGSLYAPGDDVPEGPTAEAIVAHEYGHHVAANRANNPWPAVDWGTKRWATTIGVCTRARAGELSPGDENTDYEENPGEAFAEAYRVLNERRLGLTETPWDIVDESLYPDDAALAALEQDVVSPWRGVAILRYSGTGLTRTYTVATPLDGTVRATLRAGTRGTVEILSSSGTRLARAGATASATVCGDRSVRVRVTRPTGSTGAFALTVTRP
jgi:hypothetical protein